MPLLCRHKLAHGRESCALDCPASAPCGVFEYVRVETPEQVLPAEPRTVDVALLDMNHGYPNLGHDSLVHAVQDASCDLLALHQATGIRVRVLSFDVRRGLVLPEPPASRFGLYLGTGGPGHLDPRLNDGASETSQGIREDPSWEEPLYRLFDAILADPRAALLAVCHSFGILCRWRGVAEVVLRGPEKNGKSTGVLENVFTPEAQAHPWFGRFAAELPEGRRLRVVDNRLFDLIPVPGGPSDVVPIGYETRGIGGPPGDALTMMEFARDAGGLMPRVFGVNHHPEIVDRTRQLMILGHKLERGEVSEAWAAERREILTRTYPEEDSDHRLHRTSDATLLGPLRFYLRRLVRIRAEGLGFRTDLHENRIFDEVDQDLAAATSSGGATGVY